MTGAATTDEMAEPIVMVAGASEAGRADRLVRLRYPDAPRADIAALFRDGGVRVDGRPARKGTRVSAGARVELTRAPATRDALRPLPEPNAPLDILYADEHLVAIDKPAGQPSHGLRAGERGAVTNALVARFPACRDLGDDPREAGLAHRLDTGTSGVLVAALDAATWSALRAAFTAGTITKRYVALVHGEPSGAGCDEPIAPHGRGRVRVGPGDRALAAHTEWSVTRRIGAFALVTCVARTGRMHQIRAHLAHAGAPIAGDTFYGASAADHPDRGFFLHARELGLTHPVTGARVRITAPLPPRLQHWLDELTARHDS